MKKKAILVLSIASIVVLTSHYISASMASVQINYIIVADTNEMPFTFTDHTDSHQFSFSVSPGKMNDKLKIFSIGIYLSKKKLNIASNLWEENNAIESFGFQGSIVVDNMNPAQINYHNVLPDDQYAYAYCTLKAGFNFDQYIIEIKAPKPKTGNGK